MLYPPVALYLFAPFVYLPRILWWAVPLAVLGWHAWTARPAWWSWPIIAGCLALVPTSAILVYGNTDLWSAAFLALACRYGWPAVLLVLKPSVLPLALLWARDRRWWAAAAVVGVLSLPFGSLWAEWVTIMLNVEGSLLRSANALPWLAVPLVAWLARVAEDADPTRSALAGLRRLQGRIAVR